MGALHSGHLSLLERAKAENDVVVCSIFVNPTQFGSNEDLDSYPRQLDQDVDLLESLGVDYCFAPDMDSMYGPNHVTFVDPVGFDTLTQEGLVRPGHFRGVATIVTKLLNIVQPSRAYFGQKDAAQCVLIKRIVEDLNMDVDIEIGDTIREKNGLALSSRNAYLKEEERRAASIIHQSLRKANELYQSHILNDEVVLFSSQIQAVVESSLRTEPLVGEIQYISVDSRDTMLPLEEVDRDGAVLSVAVKVGAVRLIDNIVLRK